MIRQTMDWSTSCMEKQCSQCQNRPTTQQREQVMSLSAAGTFLLWGLGVILLDGDLLSAVVTGLAAGGCAMALSVILMNVLEKRRLRMCSDL